MEDGQTFASSQYNDTKSLPFPFHFFKEQCLLHVLYHLLQHTATLNFFLRYY